MHLHTYTDPERFLSTAGPFLRRNSPENSLLLGLVAMLLDNPTPEPNPHLWFGYVTTEAEETSEGIVCGWQTLPHIAGITRSENEEALDRLAAGLAAVLSGSEYLLGPESGIAHLAQQVAGHLGTDVERVMAQRLFVLTEVIPPTRPASGQLRQATSDDIEIVTSFAAGFFDETGEPGDAREAATKRIEAGQVYLWCDPEPRSMAAWSGRTSEGVRINFVYTPEHHRGHGYASNAVADLSQRMLDDGCSWCTLYTDLANPTSNSIYRKVGYGEVVDSGVYGLGGVRGPSRT